MRAVACNHDDACITCGDVGVALTVVAAAAPGGLALCEDEAGRRERVDVSLVEPVAAGERVLVHARVALTRLGMGAAR